MEDYPLHPLRFGESKHPKPSTDNGYAQLNDGKSTLLQDYSMSTSRLRQDFTTVDWFYDRFKMVQHDRRVKAQAQEGGWKDAIVGHVRSAQAWIILSLVGFATAMTGAMIHATADWVSDLRSGYCSGHDIWMTRYLCCIESIGQCKQWSRWDQAVGADADSSGAWWTQFVFFIIFSVLFAGLSAWLVKVYSKRASGGGLPEVKTILGGYIIIKFLGIRTLFIKSITLVLSVASGLNLGKEGPLVHVACCFGNILTRPFTKYRINEAKKREIISSAAAAGVAVAFGAPLGGVLFSLESVSSYFPPKTMWRSFWCAISATLVIRYLDPFNTGQLVQFQVTDTHDWNWFELIPFAFMGICGGLLGALFIKLNIKVDRLRKGIHWVHDRPVIEVLIVAFITALASFGNIYTRSNSISLLTNLFSDCETDYDEGETAAFDTDDFDTSLASGLCSGHNVGGNLALLLTAGAVKYVLTVFTFGLRVPCGCFIPAMASGACLGRAVGWLMQLWHESIGNSFIFSTCSDEVAGACISPDVYALIGAAAMLGGITRMTVSLTVIMFELTGGGGLSYVVPIMLSIVCSKWVGDAFGKGGIFVRKIELLGYPHIDNATELKAYGVASDMMTPNPFSLNMYSHTLAQVGEILEENPHHGFPIVNNIHDNVVCGYISRTELARLHAQALTNDYPETVRCHFSTAPPPFNSPSFVDFSSGVDSHPIRVPPDIEADRVLDMFKGLGLRYILITSRAGRLLGIVKKKDLLVHCLPSSSS